MAALVMNFLALITCIIATIVAHSSDVDDTTMGCLLCASGVVCVALQVHTPS